MQSARLDAQATVGSQRWERLFGALAFAPVRPHRLQVIHQLVGFEVHERHREPEGEGFVPAAAVPALDHVGQVARPDKKISW